MQTSESGLLAAASSSNLDEVARLLPPQPNGDDFSAADENGWTAMHWLAGQGAVVELERLIALKADITVQDKTGRDAYDVAVGAGRRGAAEILRAELLRSGAAVPERFLWKPYCRGYRRTDLERFTNWDSIANTTSTSSDPEEDEAGVADVLFLHDDFSVTPTVWRDQDVIVSAPSPDFVRFCRSELGFSVPDELDLLVDDGVGDGSG